MDSLAKHLIEAGGTVGVFTGGLLLLLGGIITFLTLYGHKVLNTYIVNRLSMSKVQELDSKVSGLSTITTNLAQRVGWLESRLEEHLTDQDVRIGNMEKSLGSLHSALGEVRAEMLRTVMDTQQRLMEAIRHKG